MAHRDTLSHSGTFKVHISMSSKIKISRICKYCKNEFTARTTKTNYCSLKCSSRAFKARARELKIEQSNQETKALKKTNFEVAKARDFISVSQASDLLGISKRTIYRIISRGELNSAKFGTRTVIRKSDLDNFFAVSMEESLLQPVQEFPGLENCYNMTQIQQKFKMSPTGILEKTAKMTT